jgi:hypothetical protein
LTTTRRLTHLVDSCVIAPLVGGYSVLKEIR